MRFARMRECVTGEGAARASAARVHLGRRGAAGVAPTPALIVRYEDDASFSSMWKYSS